MGLEVVRESTDAFGPLKSVAGGLSVLLEQYDQYITNKDDVQRLMGRIKSLATPLTRKTTNNDANELQRRKDLNRKLTKVLETLDPWAKQSRLSGFIKNKDQAAKLAGLVEDIRDAITDYQSSLQQDLKEDTSRLIESTLLDKLQRSREAGYLSVNLEKCLKGTRVKVLETIENWVHKKDSGRVYWLNGKAGTGKTTIALSLAERLFAGGDLGASFFCSRDFDNRKSLRFIFPTLAFQLAYKYPDFRAHLLETIKSDPDVGHGKLDHQLKKLLVEPLRSTGLSTVIIIDALDECEDKEPASAILSLLAREINSIPSVKFFITGRPEPRIRSGFRLPNLLPQTDVFLLHEVDRRNVDEDIRLFLEHHFKALVIHRSNWEVSTPWPSSEDIRIVTLKAEGLFIYASTVVKFLASPDHNPKDRLHLITSMLDSTVYEGQSGIDELYTLLLSNAFSHIRRDDSEFLDRLLLVVSTVVLLRQPIPIASLARLQNLTPEHVFTSLRSLHSVLFVPTSDSEPIRVLHKSFPDYLTSHQRCTDDRFYIDSLDHHTTLTVRCLELMTTALKGNTCNIPRYAMNNDIKDSFTRRQNNIDEALVYACRFWANHLCSMPIAGKEVMRIIELLKKLIQRNLLKWLEVLSIVKDLRTAIHSLVDVEQWVLKANPSEEDLVKLIRECRRFVLYSFDAIEQSATHIHDSVLLWLPESSLIRTLYRDQFTTQVKVLNGIDTSWDACTRAIQLGDGAPVLSVAFSHGGDLIAGCNGSVVKVFEAATGVCHATLDGHDKGMKSVSFSSDDTLLTSGSEDSTVNVWDIQTGALVAMEGHKGAVNSVAFSPTGTKVASGANDNTIRIWDLSLGCCDRTLEGHSGCIQSVCWLEMDEVVSGCDAGQVKVWNVLSGKCLRTFEQHSGRVRSIPSLPDASRIVSESDDKTIQVYDVGTGDVIQTISRDEKIRLFCSSPNGDKVVYATDASIVVWDLLKDLATAEWQSDPRSAAFSPDGSYVAVGTSDGFVKVFQMEAGNEGRNTRDQHSNAVLCAAFAADGQTLAWRSADQTIQGLDHRFHSHSYWVRSVAFSPDSSLVASGSQDKIVRIWNVHTGGTNKESSFYTFDGHTDEINSVAFSPNSSVVASGSDDKTVRIWSLLDNIRRTLEGHKNAVVDVRFSPDGRRIVSVSYYQEVILWDVDQMKQLAVWPGQPDEEWDSQVSFSADGTCVILQFRDTVKSWSIRPSTDSPVVSLPMVLDPIPNKDHPKLLDDVCRYRYPEEGEWILDHQNRRVCWVPADRRGVSSISDGNKVVLWTRSGRVVAFDFSDVTS